MDAALEKFMEAHVRHELSRFKSKKFRETLREEATAVFQWIKKITLREIISAEQVIGLIERNVVDMPIASGITELAGEMSQRVLAAPINKKIALEEIFPRNTPMMSLWIKSAAWPRPEKTSFTGWSTVPFTPSRFRKFCSPASRNICSKKI